MIKNNAVRTVNVRTECIGNLALAPSYPSYRVLEGGQSKQRVQAKRNTHVTCDCEVRSRSNHMVVRTRQARAASVRATLLAIASMALVIAVLSLVWQLPDIIAASRVQHALQDASYQTVVVHSGDTLWDIAQNHSVSGCSTTELVSHIRDINNIQDACLQVGMQLSVPCD